MSVILQKLDNLNNTRYTLKCVRAIKQLALTTSILRILADLPFPKRCQLIFADTPSGNALITKPRANCHFPPNDFGRSITETNERRSTESFVERGFFLTQHKQSEVNQL